MKYTVAVRTLCDFTARRGDLDRRFTPSATALEGQAGQAAVAARRGAGYRSELSLAGEFEGRLHVRGRADGHDTERQRLEEVKTYRGDLARMAANRRALHWAQLKVYGALFCRQEQVGSVTLALVYVDAASQTETVLVQTHAAAELQTFFEDQCRRFLAWADQELAHAGRRDAALAALIFPHPAFRTGQRPLAETVWRAAVSGRPLLAQAPTGIGKTVATLFPLLKAWGRQRLDKVFFLTAKTPGREVALQSLARIGAVAEHGVMASAAASAGAAALPLPLRVLELVARDKACEHPGTACHGDACPLANGFYDRLPMARADAVTALTMDRSRLRQVALAHRVCPYYLGQEMVRWADVIVADYNHYFDGRAMLHGLTAANDWRVALLVDEAHNLLPRARAMYSAALSSAQLRVVLPLAPVAVAPAMRRLARCWAELARRPPSQDEEQRTGPDGPPEPGVAPPARAFDTGMATPTPSSDVGFGAPAPPSYRSFDAPPERWLAALQAVNAALADHLATDPPELPPALLAFYFDSLQLARACESFGAHSIVDMTLADGGAVTRNPPDGHATLLSIRNIVPAPFLAPRFAAARSVVLFSATLAPKRFQVDLLGLPVDTTDWVDTPSPFAARQLRVAIATHISTRFAQRADSLAPIVDLMAEQYARAPGNYLAFFSSFDYLVQVAGLFRQRHPATAVWEQSRSMTDAERAVFLDRYTADGCGIGFAVLGGAFAEGIDLAGRRLIGAFVATLGLPQVNPVNEQVRARMEAMFGRGRGHDYAYLFPGLQRVVQAAGRVIRSPQDVGTVHLIDDRFDRPEVRALLPGWWALPLRQAEAGRSPPATRARGPVCANHRDEPVNNEA